MTRRQDVRWLVVEGVITQRMADEAVLLAVDRSIYYGLNSVALRVWELISDNKSRAEIVEALLVEHDALSADVERDVETLVAALESHDLIRPCPVE